MIIIPNKMYDEFKSCTNGSGLYLTLSFNNKNGGGIEVDNKPLFTNYEEFAASANQSSTNNDSANHSPGTLKED